MNKVKIELTEPVKHGKNEITELELREPRAKDMRKVSLSPTMGEMLDIAATISNNPPSVIDQLCIKDTMKVVEVIGDFLGDSPQTGENA